MIRLIGAELFKLRSTRLYPGLLAAASGLVILVTAIQFALGGPLHIEGAAASVHTPADLRSMIDVSGVAGLFTLVLGATAVAGEARHHTIATAFLLTPQRWRVVTAKVLAYTVAGAVFGLVVEMAALAVTVGWLAATAAPIPFGSTVAVGLAVGPVATGLAAGFGAGISAAVPNQLGAVLVAVGWVMVAERLLSGLLPRVAEWLPFAGAGAAITAENSLLGFAGGAALFLAYLIAVAAAGVVVTQRRDIT